MSTTVEIDEIDGKILHILIEDARTSLKEIAKECDVSSVSVLNRIKRLKELGVITGATLFPSINKLGFQIVATIGMETDSNISEILAFFKTHTYLIEPSISIGEYDLCAVVYAENVANLNEKLEIVRKRFGIRKVTVNVWSGIPYSTFENIDLNTTKKG
jgi:Lrp/AsnC family transcriptional regulator for asnA, asnC and gidA